MFVIEVLLMLIGSLIYASYYATMVEANPLHPRSVPTVTLDDGTFTGVSAGNVNEFLGIPFGKSTYVPIIFNVVVTEQI